MTDKATPGAEPRLRRRRIDPLRDVRSKSLQQVTQPRRDRRRTTIQLRKNVAGRRIRSQFFIMTTPKPELAADGFACFATVVAGMAVVDRLQQCDTLVSARVLRKRDHPYVPEKR